MKYVCVQYRPYAANVVKLNIRNNGESAEKVSKNNVGGYGIRMACIPFKAV